LTISKHDRAMLKSLDAVAIGYGLALGRAGIVVAVDLA